MLDLIFLNRKESAQVLGISEDKFDRDVRPYIQTIELCGKIVFKLDEIKGFEKSIIIKPKPPIKKTSSTVDRNGKIIRPCDEDTAKLKNSYKKLPKGTQTRLDDLLLRLQDIADKAHRRMKG